MMSFNLKKSFGTLIPILKNHHRHTVRHASTYFIKPNFAKNSEKLKPLHHSVKNVSSSNLAKTSDSNATDNVDKEQTTSILNDDEFKSILSDFSKDFGVSSDSEQILDEIRQSLEEDEAVNEKDETSSPEPEEECSAKRNVDLKYSSDSKYTEFTDSENIFIPSHEEVESHSDNLDFVFHVDRPNENEYSTLALQRGITGVYDIEELIEVLQKENLDAITVISVPKELHYADLIVISTAKSPRHSKAVSEKVVKLYKQKKNKQDPFVTVEGEKCLEWKALDLGNIILHIFLEETRALYDIESLWLFDSAFDRGGNQKHDPLYTEIEEQMAFFSALNEKGSTEPNLKTT